MALHLFLDRAEARGGGLLCYQGVRKQPATVCLPVFLPGLLEYQERRR